MSARAAFAAATRGAWRAGGVRDGVTGTLVPGAPASYAVWDVPGGLGRLEVAAPADTVQRWSTDPRSRVPALPAARPGCAPAGLSADGAPGCRHPWLSDGVDRDRRRPSASRASRDAGRPVARAGRVPRSRAAIAAGLLVCVSFPPFGWWSAAFVAFGLLAWVLTQPSTTRAGGFGYGFLFGLAFYVPLLPWISGLVGAVPWLALSAMEALFPAVFGLLAVVVRRLPGWPVWFAGLWVLAEWLKSTVPFGGFPWGVVGFSQADGPLLVVAHFGGAPLVSFAVALVGFSLGAIALEAARWWRTRPPRRHACDLPAVVLPGLCIALVLLVVALAHAVRPHSPASGAGDDPTITVAAVQGNVPRLGLEFNAQRRAVLDNHVRETLRLAEDVRAGRAPQPAVVIWPENSSDIDPLANPDAADQIAVAAEAITRRSWSAPSSRRPATARRTRWRPTR